MGGSPRPFKIGGTYKGAFAPKRPVCTECGKKGMSPWKPIVPRLGDDTHYADCRYCLHTAFKDFTK